MLILEKLAVKVENIFIRNNFWSLLTHNIFMEQGVVSYLSDIYGMPSSIENLLWSLLILRISLCFKITASIFNLALSELQQNDYLVYFKHVSFLLQKMWLLLCTKFVETNMWCSEIF